MANRAKQPTVTTKRYKAGGVHVTKPLVVRPQLNELNIRIIIHCLNKQIAEMKKAKQNRTNPKGYKEIFRLRKLLRRDYFKLKAAIEQDKKRRVDKPKPKPVPKLDASKLSESDKQLMRAHNIPI